VCQSRVCPICGNDEKYFLYRQKFYSKEISLMKSYDVVCCKVCGFAFADNIPSQEVFDKYYADMSKYEYNHQEGDSYLGNNLYYKKIYNFISEHIKDKDVEILDVGASTGGLLSIFKENGYKRLTGIDPSETCSKFSYDKYGINTIATDLSSFDSDIKYDVVILSAVMEHVVDFSGFIGKINEMLNDDGVVFVEVPDLQRFSEYMSGSVPFQQFSTEHVNYFTRITLKNLMCKYNFNEVVNVVGENKVGQINDPDFFSLFRKGGDCAEKFYYEKCLSLNYVSDYIEVCGRVDSEIKKRIKDVFIKYDRVIVWGVGTFTLRMIGDVLNLSNIEFFVDSNKRYHDKIIDGLDVKMPADIKHYPTLPILISTFAYQNEIKRIIADEMSLRNEIITIF